MLLTFKVLVYDDDPGPIMIQSAFHRDLNTGHVDSSRSVPTR